MHLHTRLTAPLTFLAMVTVVMATSAQDAGPAETADLNAFGGRWLYVEDRTAGRSVDEQGPPMMVTFGLRVEEDAVVLERARGREECITIDGTVIEVAKQNAKTLYRGSWKDGVLEYVIKTVRDADEAVLMLIHRQFRVTPEGLQVRIVASDPGKPDLLALYRHPEDIPLPAPAKAVSTDLAWLAGAWVGTRGQRAIEERWSPPQGGALLGVSRTVSRGRMVAFEYLRIVERDGGLVYVAQPNGGDPTEFVLTALGKSRAVFENPRHDFPQRIVYERSAEGALSASIGFANGGRPRRFEFTPEDWAQP